jgi:hypothetical protein
MSAQSAPTPRSSPASRAWWPSPPRCSTAPALGRRRRPPGRFVVAAALLLLVPAFVMGTWLASSDEALEASGPDAVREAYVEDDFEAYYSSAPAGQFAAQVTVNNIQV